ncbi:hypothetical protein SUDANB135_02029 [Streptomyces sp. SudanB135_2055]
MIQRVTVPGLFPPPTYSHVSVVEAGTKLAFLAGSVPLDAEGELVGAGDPVRQAEQVISPSSCAPWAAGRHTSCRPTCTW